jgi:hypothetical protein
MENKTEREIEIDISKFVKGLGRLLKKHQATLCIDMKGSHIKGFAVQDKQGNTFVLNQYQISLSAYDLKDLEL